MIRFDLIPVDSHGMLLAMSAVRSKPTDMSQRLITAFTWLDDIA